MKARVFVSLKSTVLDPQGSGKILARESSFFDPSVAP